MLIPVSKGLIKESRQLSVSLFAQSAVPGDGVDIAASPSVSGNGTSPLKYTLTFEHLLFLTITFYPQFFFLSVPSLFLSVLLLVDPILDTLFAVSYYVS